MLQGYFCAPGSPCHSPYPEDKSNVPVGIALGTVWGSGGRLQPGKRGEDAEPGPGHPQWHCPRQQENPELYYKTDVRRLPPCHCGLGFRLSASHVGCGVLTPALTIPGGNGPPSSLFSRGTEEEEAATSKTHLQKQRQGIKYTLTQEKLLRGSSAAETHCFFFFF